MYATNACASSAAYEFTKDFDDIARPGLVRFLKHFGLAVEPEEDEDPADFDLMDSCDEAREYLRQLRGGLKDAQENLVEFDTPLACYPEIATWSRASAVALANARLDDMLSATADDPVDLDRAVRLGAELARRPRDGKQGIEVGPEATAYAADRLASKIERGGVYNPVAEAHAGILAYHALKERRGGRKVAYFDVYKLRRERLEAESKQEKPKQDGPK
jgi:hypothetical protein